METLLLCFWLTSIDLRIRIGYVQIIDIWIRLLRNFVEVLILGGNLLEWWQWPHPEWNLYTGSCRVTSVPSSGDTVVITLTERSGALKTSATSWLRRTLPLNVATLLIAHRHDGDFCFEWNCTSQQFVEMNLLWRSSLMGAGCWDIVNFVANVPDPEDW